MCSQIEEIKWLPSNTDRRFMIDGFNFKNAACDTYFLTHFHSDHTCGLSKHFGYGTVYTSEVTARLLVHDMGFPPGLIRVLPLHVPHLLLGCRVTLLDANHCPGAVMLLIEVLQDRNGKDVDKPQVILHTGDCRWEDWMLSQIPAGLKVDTIYLDTTYSKPKFTFPAQSIVIQELAQEIQPLLVEQPNTLLVVAAYHIGKEKVYLGLAQKLGIKVWCSAAKRAVLSMLDLHPDLMATLTDNPEEAQLVVTGWGMRPDQLHAKFLQIGEEAAADAPGATAAATAAAADSVAGVTKEGQDASMHDHTGEPAAVMKVHTDDAAAAVTAAAAAPGPGPCTRTQQQQEVHSDQEGKAAREGVSYRGPAVDDDDEACVACEDEPPPGVDDEGYEGAQEERDAVAAVKGKWDRVIGIKATGWTFRKKGSLVSKWVVGNVTVLGAPYSEHSSWAELCSCVRALRPSKLIPTANANSVAQQKEIIEKFVPLMDLSKQRGRLDMYLRKPTTSGSAAAAATPCPAPLPAAPAVPLVRQPSPAVPPVPSSTQPGRNKQQAKQCTPNGTSQQRRQNKGGCNGKSKQGGVTPAAARTVAGVAVKQEGTASASPRHQGAGAAGGTVEVVSIDFSSDDEQECRQASAALVNRIGDAKPGTGSQTGQLSNSDYDACKQEATECAPTGTVKEEHANHGGADQVYCGEGGTDEGSCHANKLRYAPCQPCYATTPCHGQYDPGGGAATSADQDGKQGKGQQDTVNVATQLEIRDENGASVKDDININMCMGGQKPCESMHIAQAAIRHEEMSKAQDSLHSSVVQQDADTKVYQDAKREHEVHPTDKDSSEQKDSASKINPPAQQARAAAHVQAEAEVYDLTAVDTAEQQRIWDMIQKSGCNNNATATAKPAATHNGSTSTKQRGKANKISNTKQGEAAAGVTGRKRKAQGPELNGKKERSRLKAAEVMTLLSDDDDMTNVVENVKKEATATLSASAGKSSVKQSSIRTFFSAPGIKAEQQ